MVENRKGPSSKASKLKQRTLLDLFQRREDPQSSKVNLRRRTEHSENEFDGLDKGLDASLGLQQATSSNVTLDINISNETSASSPVERPYHPSVRKQAALQPNNIPTQTIISIDEIIEIVDDEPAATDVLSTVPPSVSKSDSEGGPSQSPISSVDGGARNVIGSSLRPSSSGVQPTKVYSIFAPRALNPPARSSNKLVKDVKVLEAPYPNQDIQHVRGPQHLFPSPPISFRLRNRPCSTCTPENDSNAISRLNSIIHDEKPVAPSRKSSHLTPFLGPSDRKAYMGTIPQEHRSLHPAVARLTDCLDEHIPASITPDSSQKLWTDRWRPTHADEVLGNEERALYLRDWLHALELQFENNMPPATIQDNTQSRSDRKRRPKAKGDGKIGKRPRIVRAVERKRGRKKQRTNSDEEDNWIVNSDESIDEEFSANEVDDDEAEFYRGTRSRLYRRGDANDTALPLHEKLSAGHKFDSLTNTILLTGPPGSGKTAAVYACAEELGWEVFEVYPGIGKRNGANLDHLIGEVGRNHHVRKANYRGDGKKTGANSKDAFATFDGEEETSSRKSDGNLTENSVVEGHPSSNVGSVAATVNHKSMDSEQLIKVTSVVRQSVILLEEVDILFKEDTNFWSTVTKFIRDCKRPVICTCNDRSLIPIDDLPLQTILTFQPCPSPIAASYLQALCCAEGHPLDLASIAQLYESTRDLSPIDLPDMLTNPTTADLPVPDLRRAIHCLQLWSSAFKGVSRPEFLHVQHPCQNTFVDSANWDLNEKTSREKDDLPPLSQKTTRELRRSELYHADLMSLADSHLTRSPFDALALNDCEPSADDEMGHIILFQPATTENGTLGLYDRDELMASTAIQISRAALHVNTTRGSVPITDACRTRALVRARVDHRKQIMEVLRNVLPFPVPFTSRPAIYVDYEPWIRHIVAIDDSQEMVLNGMGSGRMTRNSQRYVRTITLSSEERNALRMTMLDDF